MSTVRVSDLEARLSPPLLSAYQAALDRWDRAGASARLWKKDASLWTGGDDAASPLAFGALSRGLGIDPTQLGAEEIKDALRRNTEQAAARGVFGVPTFEIDDELFWGADSIEFVAAFLADPSVLRNDEVRRLDGLPVAAARRT